MVIVLSMVGVNVNALLLPAGIAVAYAAKDLSHNFLAGDFSHLDQESPFIGIGTLYKHALNGLSLLLI